MNDFERLLERELKAAGSTHDPDPSVRDRVVARVARRRRAKAGGAGLLAVALVAAVVILTGSDDLTAPPTPPAEGTSEVNVQRFIEIGVSGAVAATEDRVWIHDLRGLYAFDARDGSKLYSVEDEAAPCCTELMADEDGGLWGIGAAGDEADGSGPFGTIVRFRQDSGQTIDSWNQPDFGPRALAVGDVGWVVDAAARTLWSSQPDRLEPQVVGTMEDEPVDVAVGPDGVWVLEQTNDSVRLSRFDPGTGEGGDPFSFELPGVCSDHLAVARGKLWIADRCSGELLAVDPTGSTATPIEIGTDPGPLATAGGYLWVAYGDDPANVARIDPVAERLLDRVEIEGSITSLAGSRTHLWVSGTVGEFDDATLLRLGVEDGVPPEDPAEVTPTPAESTPERSTVPVGPAGLEEVATDGFPTMEGEVALLSDVRVAGHDGFDRVVLEFESGDDPSYRVAYIEPPVLEDGSGNEIQVEGEAFLEIRMMPASGVDLSGEDFVQTYEGPRRVTGGGTQAVTEVVRTGDFEATLSWVIGIRSATPFAVVVLQDPLRLVVDIVYR